MTLVSNRNSRFIVQINEVDNKTVSAARKIDRETAKHKNAYIGTNNPLLGLTVPQQKQLLKNGYSFSKLPLDEQLLVWDAIWQQAKYHESKMQSLYWLANIKDVDMLIDFWPVISKWADSIDSWDTSDNLSSIFTRLLERSKHIIYPTLVEWNVSKNPWHRRQSIVSLLYYSRLRKIVLPHNLLLPLIENLIDDPHVYVQKGVGWSLRECHNVHPQATKQFIRKHATHISAIAFSAAAEKWPAEFLHQIKAKRKNARQKL
jgi:3-methyladenine DNA glycosylase AlkD